MKQYKNVLLSLGFYVLALIINFTGMPLKSLIDTIQTYNFATASLIGVILIVGIIFSLRSNKHKESPWAGNLLFVIGVLGFIFNIFVFSLASSQ